MLAIEKELLEYSGGLQHCSFEWVSIFMQTLAFWGKEDILEITVMRRGLLLNEWMVRA